MVRDLRTVSDRASETCTRAHRAGRLPSRRPRLRAASIPTGILLVALLVLLLQAPAFATSQIDQRAEGDFSQAHTIAGPGGAGTGQRFVPTLAENVGVRLMLSGLVITPARDPDLLDLTLNVREGSLAGAVVETVHRSLPAASLYRSWVDFDFGGSVMLSPGQTYVLELISNLGNGFWHRVDANNLPPERQAIYGGAARSWSWGFQTLAAVPEPGTALLMGLGLIGLAAATPARRAR